MSLRSMTTPRLMIGSMSMRQMNRRMGVVMGMGIIFKKNKEFHTKRLKLNC